MAVVVKIGESFQLYNSDGESMRLHSDIFNESRTFHQALFKVICGTLSTHSLKYNVTITVALATLVCCVENCKQEDIIQIEHVGLIAKIPPHYIPFIIPALRRIKDQRLDGMSVEVIDFLSDNYKWEERGNGAYYTLITNDPISGALTDQELSSIHSELNYAYSNGSISQEAFTLAWFFIGTGVRPVQAARMLNSDVQITNGAKEKR